MEIAVYVAFFGILHTAISVSAPGTAVSDSNINMALLNLGEILYNADVNRLTVAYQLQGRVAKNVTEDMAPNPLFATTPLEVNSVRSYKALRALQDNYISSTKIAEPSSTSDNGEITEFLDAVFNTTVFQEAHRFLQSAGKFPGSYSDLKTHVREIWFTTYKRQGANSSSGFEHVFTGEMKNGNTPSGMHNWVRYIALENSGTLDYFGWKKQKCFSANCNGSVLQLVYKLGGKSKKSGSTMFVGTSPEFELAVYTTCFLAKPNKVCKFKFAGSKVNIKARNVGKYVGTMYPII